MSAFARRLGMVQSDKREKGESETEQGEEEGRRRRRRRRERGRERKGRRSPVCVWENACLFWHANLSFFLSLFLSPLSLLSFSFFLSLSFSFFLSLFLSLSFSLSLSLSLYFFWIVYYLGLGDFLVHWAWELSTWLSLPTLQKVFAHVCSSSSASRRKLPL